MHLTDWKWWQWAIVGLILGALVGSVRSFYADIPDDGIHETLSQKEFERDLFRRNHHGQYSYFDSLSIVPWEGRQLILGRYTDARLESRAFRVVPAVPYKPTPRFKGKFPPNMTPLQFLDWVRQKHPNLNVQYHYAWWTAPNFQFAIWTIGGLVLIGMVWPITINLVTFGRPWRPKQPKDDYDLDRFGKDEEPLPSAQPLQDQAPAALQSHIAAIEAELEAAPGSSQAVPDPVLVNSSAALRQLNAGPLEAAPESATQGKKDYAGEFYPTVAHAPKRE